MLVFIKDNINKSQNLISLFYGPRYKRKDISNRFHNWRKSKERSDEKYYYHRGTRSQYTEQFKNWKWIITQTVLWLTISIKYNFHFIINLMAFLQFKSIYSKYFFNSSRKKTDI